MSPKDPKQVLRVIKKLQQMAAAGDRKAQQVLAQTLAAVRSMAAKKADQDALAGLVDSGALDHLLVSGGADANEESSVDEVTGEEMSEWRQESRKIAKSGEEEGTGDDVDLYADIVRNMPRADSLAHKAALKAHHHAALNEAAPFIRSNPVSILQGTLGQQVRCWTGTGLAPDQLTQQQAALWQGEDAETGPVTITVSPVLAPVARDFAAPAIPGLLQPFATIQFGTRGMSVAFSVDIGAGCQFTLTASNVSVQVGLETTVGPIASLDLAGMLSFGTIARTPTPITRSRYLGPSTGAPVTVPVPLFAKTVSLLNYQNGGEHMLLLFLNSQGTVKYIREIVAGAFMAPPCPISGEIVAVTVVENAGGAFGFETLVFELGL